MKKVAICFLVAVMVVATLYSDNVVAAFDHVFSGPNFGVSVDGDVVRSRGRYRTRRGITRFRTRGRVRADADCAGGYGRYRGYSSCDSGNDYGSCNDSDYGSCDSGNDRGSCDNSGRFLRLW